MRAHGWSWSELQATPENILGYLGLIESWATKRAEADVKLRSDR